MGVDRDVSTAYCWSSSSDDVDWLCFSTEAVGDWCISILAVYRTGVCPHNVHQKIVNAVFRFTVAAVTIQWFEA